MKSADVWLAESLDDNPADPPEKRVAIWRERIVAIQVDAMQAISEDVAMALKRSLARATAQPFVPHDARAMAELHDRVCRRPSGHEGMCEPRGRGGCELDTDGDGNCPVHPGGCPNPAAQEIRPGFRVGEISERDWQRIQDGEAPGKVLEEPTHVATGLDGNYRAACGNPKAKKFAVNTGDVITCNACLNIKPDNVPRAFTSSDAALCPETGRIVESVTESKYSCLGCAAVFMIPPGTQRFVVPMHQPMPKPKPEALELKESFVLEARITKLQAELEASEAGRRESQDLVRKYAADLTRLTTERPKLAFRQVQVFAVAMDRVLVRNSHKGGWRESTPLWLLKRLRGELAELEREVRGWRRDAKPPKTGLQDRAERVLCEAADVANFAMMIADNIARALKGKGLDDE